MKHETFKWTCSCCGEPKKGLLMDVAYNAPDPWLGLDEVVRRKSKLENDFCVIRHADGQVDRFIRCILPLPVPVLDNDFRFGVWVSVSEASFDAYQAGFHGGEHYVEGCFGYLMHNIRGFGETRLLHVDAEF